MKLRFYKQNFITIYVTILIITFAILGEYIDSPLIQYADEIFTVFAIIQIIWRYPRLINNNNYNKLFKVTFIVLISLVGIGIISNMLSKAITISTPIFIDLFSIIKLPIVFLYMYAIVKDGEKKTILNNLKIPSELFIIVVFICGILNFFIEIGMSYDIRYGIRSFTFIYANPGALNAALIIAYTIVLVTASNKIKRIVGSMALLSVIFTLRGAGIGVVGIIIMLEIYFYYTDSNKSIKVYKLIPFSILACILGYNQIYEYFISGTSLRALLLKNSIVVFKRFFPLGSGFATYGSDQAFKHYSKLYYEFGYNNIYMLNEQNGYVANDNFWPMIIAQFGIVGILCYAYLVYYQFKMVLKLKTNRYIKISAIALLSLLFIGSLGNAVYTSASGMMVYIVLGCILMNKV